MASQCATLFLQEAFLSQQYYWAFISEIDSLYNFSPILNLSPLKTHNCALHHLAGHMGITKDNQEHSLTSSIGPGWSPLSPITSTPVWSACHSKSLHHKPFSCHCFLPIGEWPWDSISMDFIEGLPCLMGMKWYWWECGIWPRWNYSFLTFFWYQCRRYSFDLPVTGFHKAWHSNWHCLWLWEVLCLLVLEIALPLLCMQGQPLNAYHPETNVLPTIRDNVSWSAMLCETCDRKIKAISSALISKK